MRQTAVLIAFVCALAVAVTGCQRAGDLIPGEYTPTVTTATPTPVVAPLLPPSGVGFGGAALQGLPTEAISDAELAASVVQIQIFDSPDGLVTPLRNGAGVVVDTEQRLVLTSYVLADPFRADGTRAYTTIAIAVSDVAGGEPSGVATDVGVAAEVGVAVAASGPEQTSASPSAFASAGRYSTVVARTALVTSVANSRSSVSSVSVDWW